MACGSFQLLYGRFRIRNLTIAIQPITASQWLADVRKLEFST